MNQVLSASKILTILNSFVAKYYFRNNEFRCISGQCIDEDNKCDGIAQCSDRSDEIKETCWNLRCPSYTYRCNYGACVNGNAQCNGQVECQDASDEDPSICKNVSTSPARPPVSVTPLIPAIPYDKYRLKNLI